MFIVIFSAFCITFMNGQAWEKNSQKEKIELAKEVANEKTK